MLLAFHIQLVDRRLDHLACEIAAVAGGLWQFALIVRTIHHHDHRPSDLHIVTMGEEIDFTFGDDGQLLGRL